MANLADKIIAVVYMAAYQSFVRKNVLYTDAVLDIGSGSGFLKPLVERQGASYHGVEPRTDVYKMAVELHGKEGFENSSLSENISKSRYDKLFAVTVLDEVLDKVKFLDIVKSYGDGDSVFFFAVRNAKFPLRRSKLVASTIDGTEIEDLDYESWLRLLDENGFVVLEADKFKRPLFTAFSLAGLKSTLLYIFFHILHIEKSYMLLFTVKMKS